jgi:hypothetical protein
MVAEVVLVRAVVGLKPTQTPPLHGLNAHWESSLQVAWKFPQRFISMKFEAQHSAPLLHSSDEEQLAPRGRLPAAAVEVADVALEAAVVVVALKPLQKPWLHVLKAHCESSLQTAWKLPQARMRPELVE